MFEKAQDLLQKAIDENQLSGACFAVVSPKDVLESKALGYAQKQPNERPMHPDTLFDMASLTKVVNTTTIALSFLDRGLLHLDTRVKDCIEECPWPDMTIQQLMTHTSGLPADDKRYKACQSKEDMLEFIWQLPMEYEPGSQCVYSDFGYILLGECLERLADRPLDQLGQEMVFGPLGMSQTGYRPAAGQDFAATEYQEDRGMICGVCHDGKAYRMGQVSGHAGLFSNVADLEKFAMALLNKNEDLLPGVGLLGPCYTENTGHRRTLGWFVDDDSAPKGSKTSKNCLFHTGFSGTSLYIDYDRQMALILLTNAIHPHRSMNHMKELRPLLHDLVLEEWDSLHEN